MLSGPITGIHIHEAEMGANGGVVTNLTDMVMEKQIQGYLTNFDLNKFITGAYYINVHTAANPDGEIRGQLTWANALVVDSWLNGAQEVPMANVPGMGVGAMWMNSTWDTLYYDYQVTGLSGAITGAHIHSAAIGSNGGVLVNLSSNVMGNRIMGAITGTDLTDALIDEVLWGTTYLNVHTAAYPDGEIRGQNLRLARDGYSFDMCGNQVDPSLGLNSYGGGILSVDRWASNAHLMFTTTELSGMITMAHLHDGMIGMDGGVLYDVSSSITAGSGYSYFDIDSANTAKIKMGGTYLNVHTADNPNGEVRGQIDNMWDCPSVSTGVEDLAFNTSSVSVYPNPVDDVVSIEIQDVKTSTIDIQVIDVLGTVVQKSIYSSGTSIHRIDLASLSHGIYFIQMNAGSTQWTERIVKN